MQFQRQTPGVSRKRLRRGMPAYRNTPQGLSSRFFLIHSSLWLTFKVLQVQHIIPSKKHLMTRPHTCLQTCQWTSSYIHTDVERVSRCGFWKLTLAQPDKTCASGRAGRGTSPPSLLRSTLTCEWKHSLNWTSLTGTLLFSFREWH